MHLQNKKPDETAVSSVFLNGGLVFPEYELRKYDVVSFCEANEQHDTPWVVLPVANFDCFYGNTNFSKKWLSKIPEEIMTREVSNGVCRVKRNMSIISKLKPE